jgi:hypothetical protein
MTTYTIYPVKLAVFRNVDVSHQLLHTRFGEKMDTACLSYMVAGEKELLVVDTGYRASEEEFDMEGDPEAAFR